MVVIGQIAGALGAGVLANAIGRKKSMVLVLVAYAVFALLGALSVSLPMLLAARLLLGLTIGVSVVVVPVYVAESAPAAVRGSLLTAYQLAIVSGLIVGYLTGYLLADTHSWRWMLGLATVPAMLLLPLLIRMPDTARWYLLKGRVDDARRALLRVEPTANVDEELAEIGRALSEGSGGMSEMLRRPYLRATIFVITLGFLIQITGINAIIYYSPRIFEAMGFTGNFALLGLPALVQVAGLAAVCTSLLLVDRLGRRPILLSGIAMMIAADVVLMAVFARGLGGRRTDSRVRRRAAVHHRLHLGFRLPGLGVRQRKLPVPAAVHRVEHDAHLQPGGQRDRRRGLSDHAAFTRRRRDFRGVRGLSRWSRSASSTGTRRRPRAASSRTSGTSGKTAAAGRTRATDPRGNRGPRRAGLPAGLAGDLRRANPGLRGRPTARGRPTSTSPIALWCPALSTCTCTAAAAPRTPTPQASRGGREFHLRHGTTTTLASLVTASPAELIAGVRALAEATRQGTVAGIHLEGPWLSRARCGAHDPAQMRDPDPAEIDAVLAAGGGAIRMVTLAPELPGADEAIRRFLDAGVVVAVGHTDATYEQTRQAIAAGATVGTHLFNAMPPLHHREPGPGARVAAGPAGDRRADRRRRARAPGGRARR